MSGYKMIINFFWTNWILVFFKDPFKHPLSDVYPFLEYIFFIIANQENEFFNSFEFYISWLFIVDLDNSAPNVVNTW